MMKTLNLLKKKLLNINNDEIKTNEPQKKGLDQDKYLDKLELSYLFSIFNLYEKVRRLPGHIVEMGVGTGRNSIIFGNLLKITSQHNNYKYFGFDTFKNYTEKEFIENPSLIKNRNKWDGNSLQYVQDRIKNNGLENICTFIEGDIRNTLDSFLNKSNLKKSSDSFYCKLLYIDTSSYTPSKIAMEKLYDHIVPGGIISIDQRTQGGETNAIIDFCNDRSLEVKTGKFFNDVPAYIVKK